ncbi:MAG: hypothetical protein C0436_04995 [Alphaproteobacteria bacterium]|nr:hypothetical protein [Alphaproteobacteria bacterium]
MTAPERNQAIAAHLSAAFRTAKSNAPRVSAYHDEQEDQRVDILICANAPEPNIDSYATLTLSDEPLARADGTLLGFGVELMGVGESGDERVADIIATCAFGIMNEGWIIAPDTVFPDVVGMYNEKGSMKHALFVDPLLGLWPNDIDLLEHVDGHVAFLQMLPISNSEYRYAQSKSVDALLDKLLDVELAPHDLNREPVV